MLEGKNSLFCSYCGKLIEVDSFTHVSSNTNFENFYSLAHNAMEGKNFDEAINYFNRILELDTKQYKAWFGKGYSTGWNGNLRKIQVAEMVNCFKQSIKNSPDSERNNIVNDVIHEINTCADAIFERSDKHTVEFASLEGTFQEHLDRSFEIIQALEYAISLTSDDLKPMRTIVKITHNLLQDLKYMPYIDLLPYKEAQKELNTIWKKYINIIDPGKIQNKKIVFRIVLFFGIMMMIAAFGLALIHGQKIMIVPEFFFLLLFGIGSILILIWYIGYYIRPH